MEADAATPASRHPSGSANLSSGRPTFAHASEAELARILDFYAVRWEYEPHTFPILWNLDGVVVESFAPDFYLPDFDTYLELTTLRQPLVRKKNRKLRRLRELYPDIGIKLLYARDFRALMVKYGKLGLLDALSGTSGQVPSPRLREVVDTDSPDAAGAGFQAAAVPASPADAAPRSSGTGTPAPAAEPRRLRRRHARAAVAATMSTGITGPDA
jgi:hypothetical protein